MLSEVVYRCAPNVIFICVYFCERGLPVFLYLENVYSAIPSKKFQATGSLKMILCRLAGFSPCSCNSYMPRHTVLTDLHWTFKLAWEDGHTCLACERSILSQEFIES